MFYEIFHMSYECNVYETEVVKMKYVLCKCTTGRNCPEVCGHCRWALPVGIAPVYCIWALPVGIAPVYCIWALPVGITPVYCIWALPVGIAPVYCIGALPLFVVYGHCPWALPRVSQYKKDMPVNSSLLCNSSQW